MIKAIITGASGVGKTTLIQALAPRINLTIIPEVARQIILEKGKAPKDMTQNELEQLHLEIFEKQIELENRHAEKGFIFDQSCNRPLSVLSSVTHLR